MQFSSIWPVDKTQSGTPNPDLSEGASDTKEGVLHIP